MARRRASGGLTVTGALALGCLVGCGGGGAASPDGAASDAPASADVVDVPLSSDGNATVVDGSDSGPGDSSAGNSDAAGPTDTADAGDSSRREDASDASDRGRDASPPKRSRPGSLAAAITLRAGGAPIGAVLEDFDGDGKLDVAVGDLSSNLVSLLINKGPAGTRNATAFAPAAEIDVGGRGGGNWIKSGDLDGDHHPDLALGILNDPEDADAGTRTVVLRNAGNGTFGAPKKVADGAVVAFADLDGDGKADLVVDKNGSLSVLLSDGQGVSFHAGGTYPVAFGVSSVAVGDLNKDGKPDLAVTTYNETPAGTTLTPDPFGGVVVLLNTGAGAFRKDATYPLARGADFVEIADVGGDGAPDLVATEALRGGGGGLADVAYVLSNKGNGSFAAPAPFPIGSTGGGLAHLVARDFDRDGKVDLAIMGADESVPALKVYRNRGDAKFAATSAHHLPYVWSLAAGDMDGDGALDFVFTTGENGRLGILFGYTDGTFPPGPSFTAVTDGVSVETGDLDGDGRSDVALARSSGVSLYTNLGGDVFSLPFKLVDPAYSQSRSVAIADLNGDHQLDVATPGASVFLSKGDGSWAAAVHYATRLAPDKGTPEAIVAGDVDGDGVPDLVTLDTNPQGGAVIADPLSVLLGKGDGTFGAPVTYAAQAARAAAGTLALADLDGDKGADLVVAAAGNAVSVLLNKGNGTFAAAVDYPAVAPTSLALGDLNGDGRPDLFVVESGVATMRLNDGKGAFGAASAPVTALPVSVVALADLDGDGKLDVLLGGDQALGVAFGGGDATFAAPILYGAIMGDPRYDVSAGDFDGDGRTDVAVLSYQGLSIFHNDGP